MVVQTPGLFIEGDETVAFYLRKRLSQNRAQSLILLDLDETHLFCRDHPLVKKIIRESRKYFSLDAHSELEEDSRKGRARGQVRSRGGTKKAESTARNTTLTRKASSSSDSGSSPRNEKPRSSRQKSKADAAPHRKREKVNEGRRKAESTTGNIFRKRNPCSGSDSDASLQFSSRDKKFKPVKEEASKKTKSKRNRLKPGSDSEAYSEASPWLLSVSALRTRADCVECFVPGSFAVATFMFVLISFRKFGRFQNPLRFWQEPLVHV